MAKREPRQTKDKILDAALDVFAARGYRDASIDDIAARAGLTKGAVYYWFQDKDDLALDLHRRVFEQLVAEATAGIDPSDAVTDVLRAGFETFLRALGTAGAARFFLRDVATIPAIGSGSRGITEHARQMIRGFLDDGIARGEIDALNPEAMSRVLIGAYNEATMYVLETGDADGARAVVDRVVRALAPERTPARRAARR